MFVSSAGIKVSDESIRTLTKDLPFINSGCYRDVYDLGEVVLKVDRCAGRGEIGGCHWEGLVWDQVKDTEHSSLFAEVFAYGNQWLVMEKVSGSCSGMDYEYDQYRDVCHKVSQLGVSDLHQGNVGIRYDGSYCVIDYAISYGLGGSGGSANLPSELVSSYLPCECCEHDCERCYPDGCECCCELHNWEGCEEYEGCNAQECEECYEVGTVHVLESGEWFGFLFGNVEWNEWRKVAIVKPCEIVHYCQNHAPVEEIKRQIPGQRGLWIDVWQNELCLPHE